MKVHWLSIVIFCLAASVIAVVFGQQIKADNDKKWAQIRDGHIPLAKLHIDIIREETTLHGAVYHVARFANEIGKRVATRNVHSIAKIGDEYDSYHLGDNNYFIPRIDNQDPTEFVEIILLVGLVPIALIGAWKLIKLARWPTAT